MDIVLFVSECPFLWTLSLILKVKYWYSIPGLAGSYITSSDTWAPWAPWGFWTCEDVL